MAIGVLYAGRLIRSFKRAVARLVIGGAVCLGAAGCGALNPAFVDLLGADFADGLVRLDNPPGHVVISLINNAEFDDSLINFLIEQGADISDVNRSLLRPLVRMTVRVTFADIDPTTGEQAFIDIEFADGSIEVIQPEFAQVTQGERERNSLQNAVVLCDVASVEIVPLNDLQVFVPVQITGYELRETTGPNNTQTVTPVATQRLDPDFLTLELDDPDDVEGGLTRNIDPRGFSSQALPLCGSSVSFVVTGVMTVPTLVGVDDGPSYDIADLPTEARIGGRYQVDVSVQ